MGRKSRVFSEKLQERFVVQISNDSWSMEFGGGGGAGGSGVGVLGAVLDVIWRHCVDRRE